MKVSRLLPEPKDMRTAALVGIVSLTAGFSVGSLDPLGQGPTPQGREQTAYSEHSERGSARIFYWGGDRSAGQLVIDYGRPAWQQKYQDSFESDEIDGRRWRLGQNHWTKLDTNIPKVLRVEEVEEAPHANSHVTRRSECPVPTPNAIEEIHASADRSL